MATPSTTVSGAVFLSYAREDTDAARRIAEALRGFGIEVWFDQAELRGGDLWDNKIRDQIKSCTLFLPIISAHTQARLEGYFRIEWDLAVERSRGIASGVVFILPIVIDDTHEHDALVPDRFRAVHWTQLPGGVVTQEVEQTLLKLWSDRIGASAHLVARAGGTGPRFTSPVNLPVGRGLAAILFTDAVGYSERMQRDERGTLALVEADFAVMRDRCALHGGEVLNSMGDGLLMCFPSAVQAVTCAMQIQADFGRRRTSLPPAQALEHRIGVHIGDVFRQESGGIAGDGVNIAARLEGKAPVGGICISQMVYDMVRGKVPMRAVFVGPETFKNIAEPVRVWHIAQEGASAPAEPAGPRRRDRRQWLAGALGAGILLALATNWGLRRDRVSLAEATPAKAVDGKAIAVLAFVDLSGDKDQEYFSDGISEELLNVLAKIPKLKVSARTSSFHFKGKDTPIHEIGRQLGVAYVVEGSVRKMGAQVRITAQLIKAADGFHVWSDTFTRDLKDIFAVQDEIAGLIAQQLQLKLGDSSAVPVDAVAFQLYLEAKQLWFARTANSLTRMEVLFGRALEIEPRFAAAEAGLAQVWVARVFVAATSARHMAKEIEQAELHGRRALEFDPASAEAYEALGTAALCRIDFKTAESSLQRAVRLNPNYTTGWHKLGWLRERQGRLDEALAHYRRARELDPLVWSVSDAVGRSLIHVGLLDEADRVFMQQQTLAVSPPMSWSNHGIALLLAGRTEEAMAKARVVTEGRFPGRWDPGMVSLSTSLAAWILAEGGARAEAEAVIARQLAGPKQLHWAAAPALYTLNRSEEASVALVDTPQQMVPFLWMLVARRPGLATDPGFLRGLEQLGATDAFRAVHAHRGHRQVMLGNSR